MMAHRCRVCDKQATHKFTRIVNGKIEEQYYCAEHADQYNEYVKKPDMQQVLNAMLKSLMENADDPEAGALVEVDESKADDIVCGHCGLTYSEYRKTLMLGCARCYESFGERLQKDLQRYHGAVEHVGRRPGRMADSRNERIRSLSELRRRMEESIHREDFREAARLRDAIRELEKVSEN
ncbi:UvrB/UvrC motif-containing protein [Candidatus Sumerlaeota bacterium]|nr:UvrB/UvrC motif-containing protein [Candidatus Sumerlaeota bacterium]